MSRAHLLSCPSCARHVRVDENACPFCDDALPSSFRDTTVPVTRSALLSRAALYALRVSALSVTTAACGGTVAGDGGGPSDAAPLLDGAAGDARRPVDAAAEQDVTPPDAGRRDGNGPSDAPSQDVFIAPPYGIPVYGSPP